MHVRGASGGRSVTVKKRGLFGSPLQPSRYPMSARFVRFGIAAVFAAATLTACAGDDAPAPRAAGAPEVPPEQLYSLALTQLDKGNWQQCAAGFDEVERQHPYSVWARR